MAAYGWTVERLEPRRRDLRAAAPRPGAAVARRGAQCAAADGGHPAQQPGDLRHRPRGQVVRLPRPGAGAGRRSCDEPRRHADDPQPQAQAGHRGGSRLRAGPAAASRPMPASSTRSGPTSSTTRSRRWTARAGSRSARGASATRSRSASPTAVRASRRSRRAHLRAVLHDQGPGRRHRARPPHRPQHHRRTAIAAGSTSRQSPDAPSSASSFHYVSRRSALSTSTFEASRMRSSRR